MPCLLVLTDVAGAVLAGGRSRRMGRDKALVAVDGRPMAERVAATLAQAGCDPVVVIGGDRTALVALGLTVVDDRWPGDGPLGAIITALAHTAVPTVVAACDLPWLDDSTVQRLLAVDGTCDVVMATTDRDQPLCACWWPSAVPELERRFADGERAVHHALTGLRVARVLVSSAALRNVNAPGDLPSM